MLGCPVGFEPTLLCRTEVGHSNFAGATSHIVLQTPWVERGRRIELLALAWKAKVLPLYEPRIISFIILDIVSFV